MFTINVFKRTDLKSPTWQYDVRSGGKRRRKSGFRTKKEAQLAAQELVNKLDNGVEMDNNTTFKDYFARWMDINNKHKLSYGQYDWYRRALNIFVHQFGADKQLRHITKQDYQLLLNRYGEGRTDESVRKVHGCLAPALRDAVYDGLLNKDPTYKIQINGTEKAQSEAEKFITINQYLRLIEHFKGKSELSYVLLYLIAITGARFSEINNLKWEDLNKKIGIIHLPGTKTDTSARDVEVNQKDIEYVKRALSTHPRRIDGYLFKLSNKAVSNSMMRSQDKVGIPQDEQVTIYGLRHTHCSYLLSKGIAIEYISKRLGHSNIGTTLNIYSHLLDEYKQEQGEKVRDIFAEI
ncbi:site-specific integrase [Salinicoccus albus]|uniref:site-specific integrase n=1 Tax=Salinicoccus albus TaxID=418756 RepID=UPI00035DD642|nr:site-specific integrase [Salinicoccus albus]